MCSRAIDASTDCMRRHRNQHRTRAAQSVLLAVDARCRSLPASRAARVAWYLGIGRHQAAAREHCVAGPAERRIVLSKHKQIDFCGLEQSENGECRNRPRVTRLARRYGDRVSRSGRQASVPSIRRGAGRCTRSRVGLIQLDPEGNRFASVVRSASAFSARAVDAAGVAAPA